MFLGGPFVRSVVHYQTCKHDILKTNEPMLVQIGTSGLWGSGMKQSTLGSGGQRPRSHAAKDRLVGHRCRPPWLGSNRFSCYLW